MFSSVSEAFGWRAFAFVLTWNEFGKTAKFTLSRRLPTSRIPVVTLLTDLSGFSFRDSILFFASFGSKELKRKYWLTLVRFSIFFLITWQLEWLVMALLGASAYSCPDGFTLYNTTSKSAGNTLGNTYPRWKARWNRNYKFNINWLWSFQNGKMKPQESRDGWKACIHSRIKISGPYFSIFVSDAWRALVTVCKSMVFALPEIFWSPGFATGDMILQ